jgi:phage host-nuclease inhibitor protein Gam
MATIKNREAARDALVELGKVAAELAVSVAKRDEEIAAINERFAEQIADQEKAAKRLKEDVEEWALVNERTEAEKDTRRIHFEGVGNVQMRTGNPTISLKRGVKEEVVIERCFDAALGKYVRTVQELNREALLNDRNEEGMIEQFGRLGVVVKQATSALFEIEGIGRV